MGGESASRANSHLLPPIPLLPGIGKVLGLRVVGDALGAILVDLLTATLANLRNFAQRMIRISLWHPSSNQLNPATIWPRETLWRHMVFREELSNWRTGQDRHLAAKSIG
jgi:hypothetical protein